MDPITRKEHFMAKIAGSPYDESIFPITREEHFLNDIAENGGGGGGSSSLLRRELVLLDNATPIWQEGTTAGGETLYSFTLPMPSDLPDEPPSCVELRRSVDDTPEEEWPWVRLLRAGNGTSYEGAGYGFELIQFTSPPTFGLAILPGQNAPEEGEPFSLRLVWESVSDDFRGAWQFMWNSGAAIPTLYWDGTAGHKLLTEPGGNATVVRTMDEALEYIAVHPTVKVQVYDDDELSWSRMTLGWQVGSNGVFALLFNNGGDFLQPVTAKLVGDLA